MPSVQVHAQSPGLRIAITRDDKNWTPYTYQTGYPGPQVLALMYDALLWHDKEGKPVPWLASGYSVRPDGRAIDVTLREGVTFQDGRPLTADDVKFTYEYVQQYTHGRFTPEVSSLDTVSTAGALSVTFNLKEPSAAFISTLMDVPILPKHLWEGIRENYPSEKASQGLPVGSGPYKMVEYQPDKVYRFEANPTYFRGRPAVPEITLQVMPELNAQILALRTGEVDLVATNLPAELSREMQGTAGVRVATGSDYTTTLLFLNTTRYPFDQIAVRQAIGFAVDSDDLVRSVLAGSGTAASPGYIHPESPLHDRNLRHEFNLAKANALLDEGGFRQRDEDGTRRSADGRRMEYQILVSSADPVQVRTAEVLGSHLARVGIKASPLALTAAAVSARVGGAGGQSQERDFDLNIRAAGPGIQDDPDRLRIFFETGAPQNVGKWSNARFDAVLRAQAQELDPARRAALVHQMENLLATERPAVVLYYRSGAYAFRPSAFDGWVYVQGRGILDVLSFVPATEAEASNPPTAATADGGSGSTPVVVAVGGGLAVAGIVVALIRRRSRGEQE